MKVLLVTENLGSGGAERQLVGLAALLKGAGFECAVVTWLTKNFHSEFLKEHSVEHILLKPKNKVDRVVKLARLFRLYSPDAVISYLPMANETCVLASFLCSIKLIVSERSFTKNWSWRRKLTYLLYRRATYVVANSNNEAENIQVNCSALASKVRVIPNFVDTTQFKATERKWQSGFKARIVGVGRVIPTKNLLNLARALALVKENGYSFELRWYGDTYDKDYLAQLEALITRLNLQDDFIIMGECHDMPCAYATADFFVMPSLLEGYPNVLVEAMASGLPVAVSSVCEHPYIVKEGVNGFLFEPNSVEDTAAALRHLLSIDSDTAQRISKNNICKVSETNSFNKFLGAYLKLI